MDNADESKYGSILKNLNQQFSLGNNQYPNSITKANSVLNNHKFDVVYTKSKLNSRNQVSKEKENANETEEPKLLTLHKSKVDTTVVANPATNHLNTN